MASNGQQVQFTPVDTGDMSDIPPDLPAGSWDAVCKVTRAATSKDKYPMLKLEWKTTESHTDGNEDFVGKRCYDNVIFPERTRAGYFRAQARRLKQLCDLLGLEVPSTASLKKGSWSDLDDFIAELDGATARIHTYIEVDKESGENRTQVRYTEPGASLAMRAASSDDEDDDEDEEEEEKPAPKKALKKKIKKG